MKTKLNLKLCLSVVFWVLSCTWGIIMTLVGGATVGLLALVKLCFYIFKKELPIRFHKNACTLIVEIGGNWGGLELGPFALCGNYSETSASFYRHIRQHEFGHNIQHCFWGPLYIFVIQIPSACRYWYEVYRVSKGRPLPATWYDSAWFERDATNWGTRAVIWHETFGAATQYRIKPVSVIHGVTTDYLRIRLIKQRKVVEAFILNAKRDRDYLVNNIGVSLSANIARMSDGTYVLTETVNTPNKY